MFCHASSGASFGEQCQESRGAEAGLDPMRPGPPDRKSLHRPTVLEATTPPRQPGAPRSSSPRRSRWRRPRRSPTAGGAGGRQGARTGATTTTITIPFGRTKSAMHTQKAETRTASRLIGTGTPRHWGRTAWAISAVMTRKTHTGIGDVLHDVNRESAHRRGQGNQKGDGPGHPLRAATTDQDLHEVRAIAAASARLSEHRRQAGSAHDLPTTAS